MQDIRPILYINGILLGILALVMLLPMLVDLRANNPDWKVFAMSASIAGFAGGSLFLTNRGYANNLSLRQAFLFTSMSYIILAFFAALPLYLADLNLHFVDAYFEATSGITATGATIMKGLSKAPPGILLWRALLNAMGGIGIVVLALAILPVLQIGGMQLFKTESSDKTEKMLPRTTQVAAVISTIFVSLTIFCALAYWAAGMNGFDAICHALTTVATGGFSTYDQSIGFFNSVKIEIIAMIFMISGALPLMLYYRFLRGEVGVFYKDPQVRFFFMIIITAVILMSIWLVSNKGFDIVSALRYASFNIISIVTTTGYTSADYSSWGSFAIAMFFILILIGGCTGSTSGGIKIFRFQVLYQISAAQINRLLQPNGVFLPRFNGKVVSDSAAASVMTFFALFSISVVILFISLSFFGLDFLTALSASAQALANVGPGLGEIVGPAGNYSTIPMGAKWLISFAMIMGRLELFTVIVLFAPRFWRD